ncbi:MAG: FmdB family zinc ribbon protein [Burkholderiales bacterium]
MPIYEYRCTDCGFQDEFLQKISEAPLTACPSCSKATFRKQVSAAGFQLKGGGWYATDFKGASKAPAKPEAQGDAKAGAKPEAKSEAKPEPKTESRTESKPQAAKTPAAANSDN